MTDASTSMINIGPGFCLWLAVLLVLVGCANPIPPTGGPKDATPPALIVEESTPNFETNFDRREIVLTFDEWIQLKDPFQQIVISPPLAKRPDIRVKGKSVRIVFSEDEPLRPQTTYTINFGASIIDLAESNPLDQFQYIFSTGPFIDSLSISGTIVQSSDGKPANDVLILLNENLNDSAFARTTPTYFTKSDASGHWQINYVRSDTFQLFALKDLNANYKYDQPGEEIAFSHTWIILPDTSETKHKLTLFTEDLAPLVLDVNSRTPGITKVLLTGPGKDLSVTTLPDEQPVFWHSVADSILIWNPQMDSLSVVLRDDTTTLDTILAPGYTGQGAPPLNVIAVSKSLHPTRPLVLQSNTPIRNIDPGGMYMILNDSIVLENPDARLDTADDRRIEISGAWVEKGKYELVLPAGSITDIFARNIDTTDITFQISTAGNFGQLFVNIEGLADSIQYLVQLQQQNGTVLDQFVVSGDSTATGSFPALPPQTYVIRIVEDLNRNKRRDSGIFAQQRQPERVQIETLEPLRAGWDLEATVTWKEQQH